MENSETIVVNTHCGRAMVSRYVLREDGGYNIVPALNWVDLESEASAALAASGVDLQTTGVHSCPPGLAERAVWGDESRLDINAACELALQHRGQIISPRTMRYAAAAGHIPGAVKERGDWRIPPNGVLYWLDHRVKPGRKKSVRRRLGWG